MTSQNDIITKIKTIVTTVTNVQAVYDGEPSSLTIYPCITITLGSFSEEYVTLRDVVRDYVFSIKVYGHLDSTSFNASQPVIRQIMDDISNKLIADITLTGSLDYSKLSQGKPQFVVKDAMFYYGEILYTARVRINRYA